MNTFSSQIVISKYHFALKEQEHRAEISGSRKHSRLALLQQTTRKLPKATEVSNELKSQPELIFTGLSWKNC